MYCIENGVADISDIGSAGSDGADIIFSYAAIDRDGLTGMRAPPFSNGFKDFRDEDAGAVGGDGEE